MNCFFCRHFRPSFIATSTAEIGAAVRVIDGDDLERFGDLASKRQPLGGVGIAAAIELEDEFVAQIMADQALDLRYLDAFEGAADAAAGLRARVFSA